MHFIICRLVIDLLEIYVLGNKLNNSQPATSSSENIHLFHKRMCCRVHIAVQTLRPPTEWSKRMCRINTPNRWREAGFPAQLAIVNFDNVSQFVNLNVVRRGSSGMSSGDL